CDVREVEFNACSVIVMLDVLLYLEEAQQERVLENATTALRPGGLLLLREPDADAGLAFWMTKLSAWLEALTRGKLGPKLHCRSAARWVAALSQRGRCARTWPPSNVATTAWRSSRWRPTALPPPSRRQASATARRASACSSGPAPPASWKPSSHTAGATPSPVLCPPTFATPRGRTPSRWSTSRSAISRCAAPRWPCPRRAPRRRRCSATPRA